MNHGTSDSARFLAEPGLRPGKGLDPMEKRKSEVGDEQGWLGANRNHFPGKPKRESVCVNKEQAIVLS